jgi:hypothetical protein
VNLHDFGTEVAGDIVGSHFAVPLIGNSWSTNNNSKILMANDKNQFCSIPLRDTDFDLVPFPETIFQVLWRADTSKC